MSRAEKMGVNWELESYEDDINRMDPLASAA